MKYKITRIQIHHFRSISDLVIDIPTNGQPTVVCGPNNVGKTNILRALKLFFDEKFLPEDDVPYHIVVGSRGQGFKTIIDVQFFEESTKTKWVVKKNFTRKKRTINVTKTGYKHISRKGKKSLTSQEIDKFLQSFWYIFIEASNVDLPRLITDVVKTDVLSTGLDRLRKKQKIPLDILKEFVDASGDALKDIENEISDYFRDFIKKNDSIKGIKEWQIEINFPKFENLREAISDMVSFTLYDTNRKKLDFKGSGIQRLLFLSLVQYISSNTKKNIIWGIDEPEIFLQPGIQKEVYRILRELSKRVTIILTTHSHHFIDLNELDNCLLLDANYEIKNYKRRQNEQYFKVDTHLKKLAGFEKVVEIKKHMGIQNNDSWEIMPYNILVEGEEDKDYLIHLLRSNDIYIPNIYVAYGADKIKGYLSFLENFAMDLNYKPTVLCLLDHDSKGKMIFDALTKDKYKNIKLNRKYVVRYDGKFKNDFEFEIEDLIYPEIIFEAVNEILLKKSYSQIDSSNCIVEKEQAGYLNDPILKYITNEVTSVNKNKEPVNFEHESMKQWLCKTSCKSIKRDRCKELNKKYPSILKFLQEITSSNIKDTYSAS